MQDGIYAGGDELPTYRRFTTKDGRDLTVTFGGMTESRWSGEDAKFSHTYVDIRDGLTHLIRLCHEGTGESRVLAHGLIVVLKEGEADALSGECVVLTIEEE